MRHDYSVSLIEANLYSTLFVLPAVIVFSAAYIFYWGISSLFNGLGSFFGNLILFIIIFLLGVVVHECIHGVTWMLVGRKPLSAIKFGVYWWALTPYAHCTEPMEVNAYRIGAAMPGLLLGLAPCIGGIIFGNGWWFVFGLLFTYAACGDALILWLLRKVKAGSLVEDHPSRAGCYVIDDAPKD